ncbi:hypothetical protein M5K25_012624 [Dendrobium thyrsiflorum]|uniref:Uncharacterized protein n=1 Tax=Dendrobium thyrsiflorum TaxID=117978 RepID=A0ABD0V4I7_DENTH
MTVKMVKSLAFQELGSANLPLACLSNSINELLPLQLDVRRQVVVWQNVGPEVAAWQSVGPEVTAWQSVGPEVAAWQSVGPEVVIR